MRIAGLALLGMTFALLGQYTAHLFSARVHLLEKAELMLSMISNEISFLSLPSDELVATLCERKELAELRFLADCRMLISNGSDFKSAWQNSLRKHENIKYFNKSDISVLSSFADSFGTTDSEGQILNCTLYIRYLKENLDDAKCKREKYSAMLSGLGILSGIGIIVVLI